MAINVSVPRSVADARKLVAEVDVQVVVDRVKDAADDHLVLRISQLGELAVPHQGSKSLALGSRWSRTAQSILSIVADFLVARSGRLLWFILRWSGGLQSVGWQSGGADPGQGQGRRGLVGSAQVCQSGQQGVWLQCREHCQSGSEFVTIDQDCWSMWQQSSYSKSSWGLLS